MGRNVYCEIKPRIDDLTRQRGAGAQCLGAFGSGEIFGYRATHGTTIPSSDEAAGWDQGRLCRGLVSRQGYFFVFSRSATPGW